MADESSRRRRFFRISLRVLFLLITAACMWVGLLSYRARCQRKAKAVVTALGGAVFYDGITSATELRQSQELGRIRTYGWLRKTIGDEYLQDLTKIQVWRNESQLSVTDEQMRAICSQSSLESLTLRNCGVDDAMMRHLLHLGRLRHLNLDQNPLSDAGLRVLSNLPSLSQLSLSSTCVTDEGVKYLAAISSLNTLVLDDTKISDLGVDEFVRMRNLSYLSLCGTRITDGSLALLGRMTWLDNGIDLTNTAVTDSGLSSLSRLTKLRVLVLQGAHVTPEGVGELERLLPMTNIQYSRRR